MLKNKIDFIFLIEHPKRELDYVKSVASSLKSKGYSVKIISIHFYGSGCSTPERNTVISRGLELYFPKADVTIYHDIQAAVNATCNHTLGIVGILGTGSNYVRRWKKN